MGGGRYRPGGTGARNAGPFDGVRVNLFDIFRFRPGNGENLGVPKARWRNILVKLDVSLEELLSGVVKEVDVSLGGRDCGWRLVVELSFFARVCVNCWRIAVDLSYFRRECVCVWLCALVFWRRQLEKKRKPTVPSTKD